MLSYMTLRHRRSRKTLSRAAAAVDADLNVGCEQAGSEGVGCGVSVLGGVGDLGLSHV